MARLFFSLLFALGVAQALGQTAYLKYPSIPKRPLNGKGPAAYGKKLVRAARPVSLNCQVANQNPPFRVVTCKLKSRLAVPICPVFTCSPAPPANCNTGPGASVNSNQACSWSITPTCSTPAPVYPSRGNEWGFGWIFTEPGPVSVQLKGIRRVSTMAINCSSI